MWAQILLTTSPRCASRSALLSIGPAKVYPSVGCSSACLSDRTRIRLYENERLEIAMTNEPGQAELERQLADANTRIREMIKEIGQRESE